MLKLLLQAKRMALHVTIDGQMMVLAMPLDREYRTKVMLAHARTEAELLKIDADIRRLERGHGIRAMGC